MNGGFDIAIGFLCSAIVFLTAIAWRAIKIVRLPLHVRWELYPVAHEKGRASYGGSYLEESDWWTKPRAVVAAGGTEGDDPRDSSAAGVWEHNRKHWFRSFPFHFGLYLLAGLIALLLLGGIATAARADVSAQGGPLGPTLYHLTYIVGYAGLGLGLIGSVALLVRRTFDPDYREYTKKADYFNLAFFVVTIGRGPGGARLRATPISPSVRRISPDWRRSASLRQVSNPVADGLKRDRDCPGLAALGLYPADAHVAFLHQVVHVSRHPLERRTESPGGKIEATNRRGAEVPGELVGFPHSRGWQEDLG